MSRDIEKKSNSKQGIYDMNVVTTGTLIFIIISSLTLVELLSNTSITFISTCKVQAFSLGGSTPPHIRHHVRSGFGTYHHYHTRTRTSVTPSSITTTSSKRKQWKVVLDMIHNNDNDEKSCEECIDCQNTMQPPSSLCHEEKLKEHNNFSMLTSLSEPNKKKRKKTNNYHHDSVSSTTRREILSLSAILGGLSSTIFGGGDDTFQNVLLPVANAVDTDSNVNVNVKPYVEEIEQYIYPNPPIIPFSSVRQQKLITLSNGLRVLIVNDNHVSQSTAALIIHGPGQFQDPDDLPGAAHLMEHMIMSYKIKNGIGTGVDISLSRDGDGNGNGGVNSDSSGSNSHGHSHSRSKSKLNKTIKKVENEEQDGDLEDWLGDYGGASNAFTAYDETCFHINCPHEILPSALEQFATLFMERNVVNTCQDSIILAREIRRVNDELDLDSMSAQQEYVTKSFIRNLDEKTKMGMVDIDMNVHNSNGNDRPHPFSKFTRGSLASLETIPKEAGIDVSEKLIQFYREFYIATQAVLVVVSNQSSSLPSLSSHQSLSNMERWVAMFDNTMSKSISTTNKNQRYHYPATFNHRIPYNHVVLYPKQGNTGSTNNEGNEKVSLQWVLNESYKNVDKANTNVSEIAFVLNQLLGCRGPGSLYQYLRNQDWIQCKSTLPPQVTIPMNVSGFQILKLDILLTPKGFRNRSKVVAAVYESIESIRNRDNSFLIPIETIAQYSTMAKLFGYILTPRPPDAVELAIDSMNYGVENIQSGIWYRFPSTDDIGVGMDGLASGGLSRIQRAVASALEVMSDPKNALVIVIAGDDARERLDDASTSNGINYDLSTIMMNKDSSSNTQLYSEDILAFVSDSTMKRSIYTNNGGKKQLFRPVYNPLVPLSLTPPRIINTDFESKEPSRKNTYHGRSRGYDVERGWTVLMPEEENESYMPLPRSPPEANCRGAFVLQLLSSRPLMSNAEQAAYGELWRLSFEDAVTNFAQQGASGGLAYELRFNQYGMRISFLGPSQTLPFYIKRMMELLTEHQMPLLKGKRSLRNRSIAIAEANKARDLSPMRRKIVIDTLQKATVYDVALEGIFFLRSVESAVCFSQGDLTPKETRDLLNTVQEVLKGSIGKNSKGQGSFSGAMPSIDDLIATPMWKPRNGSPCYVPGVSLMSDACGRVLR